jgi:hypothetical protein
MPVLHSFRFIRALGSSASVLSHRLPKLQHKATSVLGYVCDLKLQATSACGLKTRRFINQRTSGVSSVQHTVNGMH